MPEVEKCTICAGRGRIRIEGCIKEQIRPEAWDLLEMCHFCDNGTWPVGGGVLDQTPCFLRARKFVRIEKAIVEAEALKQLSKK
jgi:hypothetical protein